MMPNFLILGVPRSGTTTTYEGLKQHPQVFVSPIKEPMFFILQGEKELSPALSKHRGPRDLNGYQSLFRGVVQEKAVGEASTYYLFSPQAPLEIKKYIPEAKMIAIFRNPVDRAYSHFLLNRLAGAEPIADFKEAFDAEEERIRKKWFPYWSYRGVGYYGQQIERYFSLFDRAQFRFFLFEDLKADPDRFFMEIFQFLGVEETINVRLPVKYNPSGVPRNRIIHGFLSKPNFIKSQMKRILPEKIQYNLHVGFMNRNLAKPPLPAEVRRRILALYREDILKTQDLIHRDLSSWLSPEPRGDDS
jgi:hypothetical protein